MNAKVLNNVITSLVVVHNWRKSEAQPKAWGLVLDTNPSSKVIISGLGAGKIGEQGILKVELIE